MLSKYISGTGSQITLLTLMTIAVVGQLYLVIPLFAAMAATFGCSPGKLAITSSAFGVPYAFAGLVAGPLADSWGAQRVIVMSLAATAFTTLAVGLAPSFVSLVLLRSLQGVTAGFLSVASFAYITRHLHENARVFATTSVIAAAMSSALLMQVFGQFMAEHLGWRFAFVVSVPALAVLAAVAAAFLARPARTCKSDVIRAIAKLPSLMHEIPLMALYGAALTLLGGFVAIYAGIALYGTPEFRDQPENLFLLRTTSLPVMATVPFLALGLKGLPPRRRIIGGLGMSTISMVVAATMSQDVWILAISIAVCVAGLLISAPAIIQCVAQFAIGISGAAVSLYTFAIFIGASLGPQFAVLLAPVGLSGLLLFVAALFAVGLSLGAWGASSMRVV